MKNLLYDTKKLLVITITVSYIIAMMVFSFNDRNKDYLIKSDFLTYYSAAKMLRMGKTDRLYDLDFQHEVQAEVLDREIIMPLLFRNPPITAYFYSLFTNFEPITAYRIYLMINIFVTFLTLYFLCRYLKLDSKYFLYSIWFLPTMSALYNAQLSSFLLLSYVIMYVALRKKKDFIAGLAVFFLFLKIQYLISIPFMWVLSKAKKKFLLGAVISLGVCILVSFSLYGKDLFSDYLNYTVLSESIDYQTMYVENFNLMSFSWFFRNTSVASSVHTGVLVVTIIGLLLTYVYFYAKRKNVLFDNAFAAAIIFSITLNLHSLASDLIFLLIPFLLISSKQDWGRKRRVLFLYSLYLLSYLGFFDMSIIAVTMFIYIAVFLMLHRSTGNHEQLSMNI